MQERKRPSARKGIVVVGFLFVFCVIALGWLMGSLSSWTSALYQFGSDVITEMNRLIRMPAVPAG